MRKYISLKDPSKFNDHAQIPFDAWNCITLQIKGQADVYLVIKNQQVMTMFLKFLIYHLRTLDGVRDSAKKLIQIIVNQRMKNI